MADVKKVKEAFFNNQLKTSKLCEVFCEKTNAELKTLQKEFAKDEPDADGLQKFVTDKMSDRKRVVNNREHIKEFIIRVLADSNTRADPSEREKSTSVDTNRAKEDAAKLQVEKLKPDVFLNVFLGKGGSMTFSQVKETVKQFEEEDDDFIGKLEDSFDSPFLNLCVRYIEFALKWTETLVLLCWVMIAI